MRRLLALGLIALLWCALAAMPAEGRTRGVLSAPAATAPSVSAWPMIRVSPSPGTHVESAESANQTSANWSGYAAATDLTSGTDDSVSDVTGTWIVPTVTGGTSAAYCADWIGFDGFQSTSVEQIGTEENWTGSAPTYSAWWEMYPTVAEQSIPMAVHPGDVMAADVRWVSGNTFALSLTDKTTGATYAAQQTLGTTAERSSAEWIHEAPATSKGHVLPLAQTTSAPFSGCNATINGTTGPIDDSLWQSTGLDMVQSGVTLEQAYGLSAGGTSFVVAPPGTLPHISPSSASLTFGYFLGGTTPAAQRLSLANTGGGTLTWSAASDSSWLSCTPGSGGSGDSAVVSVDPSALAVGTYVGHIIITASGTDNTPLSVPVTLRVALTPGKITVNKPSSVKARRSFKLSGAVYPHGGAVRIRRYVAYKGTWKSLGTYVAEVAAGAWKATVNTTAKGHWKFVAQYIGDGRHAPASAACYVTAK